MDLTQDITQALKDTENSLRDFISVVLREKLGESWLENCGISSKRLMKWKEHKEDEAKRQESGAGVVEQRLIYYADFDDLRTILERHWLGEFSIAFGDWKRMDVFLTELKNLRDPDAHRRELLPHQKHLILGIAGEIRTRLIRYRSKKETSEDYYPRIESARDSLGNIRTYSDNSGSNTGMRLRVGDAIDFVITATDPLGEPLQYAIYKWIHTEWQDSNVIALKLTEQHVQKDFSVVIVIKSNRQFHAHGEFDDSVYFDYEVLPPK
jgi:hypothetical protein